jgi:hypothetical protein
MIMNDGRSQIAEKTGSLKLIYCRKSKCPTMLRVFYLKTEEIQLKIKDYEYIIGSIVSILGKNTVWVHCIV